jgi:HK97 family phage major capsid protein
MAASRVKKLLDELASTLAELDLLDEQGEAEEAGESADGTQAEGGERSAVQAVEARQVQYDALVAKAERIKAAIAKEESREAKKAELLKVLNRAAPAPVETTEMKTRIEPVSYRGYKPGVFESPEVAHRCGQWLKSLNGDREATRWCSDHLGSEFRDMGGQVNSLGGSLVFEDFSNSLIRLVETFGVSMNLAQRVTMSSDTLLVPKRLSGVTGYWLGENTTITTSDPTATMVQMVLKKLAAATRVSNELLADNAISVAQWLVQEYATTISGTLDDAFFNGDGTLGSYGGIRGLEQINDGTHTASVVSAASGNTTLATLDIDDYLRALAALPRYAIGTSAWYMHPAVYHQSVQRMMLSSGTVGSGTVGALAGGNTAANLAQGTPNTFLGLPVVWVLKMRSAPITNQIYAYVGDLSLSSIMANKGDMQIASSTDRYFEVDQTAWRVTYRVDINHHSLGTNSEAGPVVALKLA